MGDLVTVMKVSKIENTKGEEKRAESFREDIINSAELEMASKGQKCIYYIGVSDLNDSNFREVVIAISALQK